MDMDKLFFYTEKDSLCVEGFKEDELNEDYAWEYLEAEGLDLENLEFIEFEYLGDGIYRAIFHIW